VTPRIDWPAIIDRAAVIVRSYDTSVTLRQLFYRLVSEQLLPNSTTAYKGLSAKTAEARRQGTFPALIDRGRTIHRRAYWDGPADALRALASQYRRDRTAGQDVSLYIGVEKAGMVIQLQSWFGDLGIPVLALGGYSSQTYVDEVARDTHRQGRDAILLYAGDFDPSGEDIDRDFEERSDCWDKVLRVALTSGQVTAFGLPPNPGKITDSRAAGFIARHGQLVQVELDALDPNQLRGLYQTAIDEFWDASAYTAVRAQEREDLDRLWAAVADSDDDDDGVSE
jgi:hypothetical protein